MLNLLVLSKYQDVFDNFLESMMPTIRGRDVRIWAVTEGLKWEEEDQIIRVDRTEFHPPKYFNRILRNLPKEDSVGVINDDIIFSPYWYMQVTMMLRKYNCISPGFYENPNINEAKELIERVKGAGDGSVFEATYMPCYFYNMEVVDKIGLYDENLIDYYDIDWHWRALQAGYRWMTAEQITIVHLCGVARGRDRAHMKPLINEYRPIFIRKVGNEDFLRIKRSLLQGRKNRKALHW